MAQNEVILRQALAGIEAVRGTTDTVTRRIYETVTLNDAFDPLEFAENSGTYDAWRTFVQGPVTVSGTVEGPASFQDLPFWLLHGISGGVTADGDEDDDEAFEWEFVPVADEDDLASSTMQHGVPDNVYISDMVMLPSWSLRGDIDGDAAWMFSGNLIAKNLANDAGGFEEGVADRTREFIRAAGTTLSLDGTPVVGKFISFSLDWDNAVTPKRFMEDESGISSVVGRGARMVTGQIRMEFDDDSERANFRAGTERAITIERTGSTIHDAVTHKVTIDIPRAYWVTMSPDSRDTNMTITAGFRAYMSDDDGYAAAITVVNAEGTV